MTTLAPWADILIAVLTLAGAALALLGSIGLLRLPTFFDRLHAPALIATGGCWCLSLACLIFFSLQGDGWYLHPLLIIIFLAITVPVTTIFLMRASLFRARENGEDVPANLSRKATADAKNS
ncbi:Na+/H+ antiporter subunit G [Polaromonas sp.]|nr:Na+/H+ antiporter subunit G [Polaromonas sp.]